jgi:cytochrome oxidase Cu insertion factor (SCO1/SenC/PrrC family)
MRHLRRRSTWLPLAAMLLLTACQTASNGAPSAAAPAAPAAPARELRVGDRAPDFALPDQNRQEVRLSQFRGRPVQVAFYVYAFSGG